MRNNRNEPYNEPLGQPLVVINMAINHSLGLTLPLIFPTAQLTLFTVEQSQDQSMFYLVAIQKLNKVV